MEQDNNQNEFADLSQVLNEVESMSAERRSERKVPSEKKIPGIYRLIFKISGGVINTEKQARALVIVFIIIINLFTLSLIFRGGETEKGVSTVKVLPAQTK